MINIAVTGLKAKQLVIQTLHGSFPELRIELYEFLVF